MAQELPVKKKPTKKNKITYLKLRKYNLWVAVLFALQGVLVLVFSDPAKSNYPITNSFLAEDKLASEAAGHSVLVNASHHLFDINLAYVVAVFFFISSIAHLLIATWKRKQYEKDLKKGVNRARWIEYAFSISTMMIAIALLTGIFDLASLVMIFALTSTMCLLGMTMELRNQNTKEVDWANYSVGIFAGIIPWLVVLIYLWGAHVYGNGLPGYIYWIYASILILFSSFAVNVYLQYKRLGNWSTYLYGERLYIILSFVAKTALAWQVFAGTLSP